MAQMAKSLPTMWETQVRSLVRKTPWRRKLKPIPVFLPGKSHGWRSLVGYSPWDHKESDSTEWLLMLYSGVYIYEENDEIVKLSLLNQIYWFIFHIVFPSQKKSYYLIHSLLHDYLSTLSSVPRNLNCFRRTKDYLLKDIFYCSITFSIL